MMEIAATLRKELGVRGQKIPTRSMPDFVVKLLAWFAAPLRSLMPLLGRRQVFDASKARRILGFAPRPANTTLLECAESLMAERRA